MNQDKNEPNPEIPEFAIEVLINVFPNEAIHLGYTTIEDIVNGVNFQSAEDGYSIDLSVDIETLKNGMELLLIILQVGKFIWDHTKQEPTLDEIKRKLKTQFPSRLDTNKQILLHKKIIEKKKWKNNITE